MTNRNIFFAVSSLLLGSAAFAQPSISSVVNAGDFSPRLCPGCDAAIFGSGFAAGAAVTVNGSAAYVISVSASQVNVQLPYSLSTGSATVTLNETAGSASVNINILSYAPAFGANAVFNSSSQAIGAGTPAQPGQPLTAYLFGLGETTPAAPLGPVGVSPLYNTLAIPSVGFYTNGGTTPVASATISFSGLAPGNAGLYQINFTVPGGLAPGTYNLGVNVNGYVSNTYQIPVASSSTTAVNITNNSNLGTWTIGTDVIPLNASGGNGLYTWSVTSGSLPPGMAIRYGVGGNAAALAGVATAQGNYNFTLQVSSGGQTDSLAMSLRITNLVAAGNYNLPDAFTTQAYSYTFTPVGYSGWPNPPGAGQVTFNSGAVTGLPGGMSISAAGVLQGTPASAGTYNIKLSFTDNATGDTCFRSFQLHVTNVGFSGSGALPNATSNQAYSASVQAFGGDGSYTYSAAMPNGLTLNPSTGAISGTANFNGKWNFNITVSDGGFGAYTRTFSLDAVGNGDDYNALTEPNFSVYGPVFTDCTFGQPCLQGIFAGGGKPPYTWTVTGLPCGMNYSTANNGISSNFPAPGDMGIWGVPLGAPGSCLIPASGTYNVTVKVTDASSNTATQIFPLHVSNLSLFGGTPGGNLGAQYNGTASGYPFTVLGGAGSGYTGQLLAGPLPDGLSFNGGAPLSVAGTPLENGSFSMAFSFTDGTNTLTVPQYININGPSGSTIQINNSNLGMNYGLNSSINYQLGACCAAGSIVWTAPNGLPSGFSLSPSGLLTGTTSTAGTYSFLAQATDSANSNNYAVRLITFGYTPMYFNTTSFNFGNVSAVYPNTNIQVSGATGSVTCTLDQFLNGQEQYLPPGMSLSGCTLMGTPTQAGQFYFAVTATDSANHSVTATFSIGIYPAGQTPAVYFCTGNNLGTWSIGEIQDALSACGGNGSYTWSYVSGNLPTGLSLRTDFPSWFPLSASAGLIGVATVPGTYTFTLAVTSAGQAPLQQTFTMKITAFDLADSFNLPDAFAGQSYSHQFTTLNLPPGATASFGQCGNNSFNLPPGLSLSPSGLLSGTIPAGTSGYYNMDFSYSDGTDSVCWNTNLLVSQISVSIADAIQPGVFPNATQNSPYSATVSADGGTGPYNWTTNGLPPGLSLSQDSPSATISGTPTSFGKYNFILTATDANKVSYSYYVSLDVIGVPTQLPKIVQYGNFDSCAYGWPCSLGVGVYNGGVAPFTWTVTGLPAGMSYRQGSGVTADYYSPGDVEIWGRPLAMGSFPVTLTVQDANCTPVMRANCTSTSETYTLNIGRLWQDNGLANGTYEVPYNSTARIVGGTPPYKTSISLGTLPDGITIPSPATTNPAGLTASGTPQESGNFNAQFQISDSAGNAMSVTDYINIAGPPNSGITVNTSVLGPYTVGTALNVNLNACCAPSYTWSFAGAAPAFLSLSAGGTLTGSLSTAGTYQFLVKAQDSTNAANYGVRQITLIVTPLSLTPFSPLPYGNVGVPYSQTFTVSGTSNAVTWKFYSQFEVQLPPPGFTLTSSGAATAVFAGPSGGPTAAGDYTFTVVATDSVTGSYISRTYTLNIYPNGQNPPLDLPVGPNLGTYQIGNVLEIQLNPTGGVPPYILSYSPGATPLPETRVQTGGPYPTFFTAAAAGAILGVIPSPGTYNSSVRVTDGTGATFDAPVTVTVLPITILYPNSNPLPKATIDSAYSFQLNGSGGSGNYGWSATGLPAGLAFSSATPGLLTGTPTASGSFNPVITMTDLSNSTSVSYGFTLVVNPYAINNSAVLPQGTVGIAYPTTTLTVSDGNCGSGCSWSFIGGFPNGLTLSNAGVISGTPTGIYYGGVTIQATGSAGTVQKLFTFQIVAPTVEPLLMTGQTATYNLGGPGHAMELFAQGGMPPYHWSLASGNLPPGVTLQGPGETLSASAGPGFTYLWGRVTVPGTYNFTLTVTDSSAPAQSVSQPFTWVVQQIELTNASFPVAGNPLVYGQPYSQPLLVAGGSGSYNSWFATGLPPGLSIDPSTGVISGTPQATGTFTPTVTVKDTSTPTPLTGQYGLTLNVASPTGTAISINLGPNLGAYQQGNAAIFNLNPTGGTTPYAITALSSLPPGCAIETASANTELSNANGAYDLACVFLAAGTYSFTLEATDNATPANIGVKTLTVMVTSYDLYSSTALPNASAGLPYASDILAFDNSSAVTWSVAPGWQLPPGLTLSGNQINGTPSAAGSYIFNLTATDSSNVSITYGFSLNVSSLAITNPPAATGNGQFLPVQGVLGQPFTYAFAASGGSPLSWSASGVPSGLTLAAVTGLLSGTPNSSGFFRMTVTVTSGASSFTRVYGFYVSPGPSLLSYNEFSTTLSDAVAGAAYSYTLIPSGGIPPYTWSVAPGPPLPAGLSLISGTNLPIGFTPGTTFIGGVPTTPNPPGSPYTFTLICTDSTGARVQRTFSLNVGTMGILPGSLKTGTENTVYNEQLPVVGGVPPYTFTYAAVGANSPLFPTGVSGTASGLITGTPTSTGTYNFQVIVTDSAHPANTFFTTYSLTVVNGPNNLEITTAQPFDLTVGGRYSANETVTGGVNGASYTYTVAGGSLPAGLALVRNANGTTTLEGAPGVPGPYTYTLHVTDGSGNTADRTYNGVVMPVNQTIRNVVLPTGVVGLPYNAGAGYQLGYIGNTSGHTFTELPLYPLPPGMSLSATGLLSGTPQVSGSFPIYFSLKDNATGLTSNTGGVTLYVTPPGTPLPLSGQGVTTGFIGSINEPVIWNVDLLIATGTPPYTWSLQAGSSLPAGFALLQGTGGMSSYLAGVSNATGQFLFNLVARDATGQSIVVPTFLTFDDLGVSPYSFQDGPHGAVGTSYNQTYTVTGGTPPYAIGLSASSDLPPGVAFTTSANGFQLSGTPTYPGNFQVNVNVTDSASNTGFSESRITIDSASGGLPGLSLQPNSGLALNFFVGSSSTPSTTQVTVASTSGSVPFTAEVLGIPGATLSAGSGTAPTTLTLTVPYPAVPETFSGVIAIQWQGSGYQYAAIPVTVTAVNPPPCSYSANPGSGPVNADGSGAAPFTLVTGSTCRWTVSDPDSWVTITSAASGTGQTNVTFTVAANPNASARTSNISINGGAAIYQITQFGSACSFSISPSNLMQIAAAGGEVPVTVTASSPSCSWSASGLSAAPTSGTGNGTVTVTIPPNATGSSVSYSASIAPNSPGALNFTASQTGANCVASFSPSSIEIGSAGASANSLSVTAPAGCSYSTANVPAWVTVTSGATSSGPGPNTFSYTVAANSATVARSATIAIGGTAFTINQDALACSVTLDTSLLTLPLPVAGGGGTIGVIANGANCSWAASSGAGWASVAPASGVGNGQVVVTAASNAGSAAPRNTSIDIAGTSVTISQAGANCAGQYSLASLAGSVPAAGGNGTVGVTAPAACTWSSSTTTPWLTIDASGTSGNSSVQFAAAPNSDAAPRSGTLTIAGLTYTVNQAGAPCSYVLPSSNTTVASTGVTGATFTFTTTSGCTNTAMSYSGWITNVSTTYNADAMSGTVTYTVAANPAGVNRTGTLQIGNQTYTVTQSGAACGYSLNSYGALFSRAGGSSAVVGSPTAEGCTPSVGTDEPTFVSLGTLSGPTGDIFTLPFDISQFTSEITAIRRATISFGGLTFLVKQTSW